MNESGAKGTPSMNVCIGYENLVVVVVVLLFLLNATVENLYIHTQAIMCMEFDTFISCCLITVRQNTEAKTIQQQKN